MAKRRKPTADERVAACLLQIKRGNVWLIPEPLRSTGTARELCAYVNFDHIVPHAIGGTMKPQNLQPLPRAEHKEKTAKIDVPRIAKGKRLEKAHIAHKAVMEAKAGRGPAPARKAPKGRPMPGSRASGWKRRLNGSVERRA